ncbi:MAG: biotin--[acetyl-CoA-carboxylase] ligase [Nitrososphaeraceae archaeon]|jgi:BirA family biotin operon repressor/biotin-[acetyl-CoA-carboxylase] ligase
MNFELAHLKVAIGGCVFGREIRSFKEISSTQDYAISIAETEPCCHGLVVISESQLFGRGRRGNRWISPPGGLWFSVIIKSGIKTSYSIFLSYAMSLAVCETIANNFNLKAFIKWPNDVLIKTRKVAGILVSSAVRGEDLEYCVVGAGINLNSRPKRLKRSTSLIEHTSQSSIPIESFLVSVLALFNNYYGELQSGNWELITKRWKSHCPMMGKRIKVVMNEIRIDGIASNIDSNGFLILVTRVGQIVKISDSQYASIKIKP